MIQLTPEQIHKADQAAAFLREIAEALSNKNDDSRIEVRLEAKHKADYSKPSAEWYSVVAVWRITKEYETLYAQEADDLSGAISKMNNLSELDRAKIRLNSSREETRRCAREVRRLTR